MRTRVKETNSLVIRQNETRLTGVVRHNHTIIEKEVRYVRRVRSGPLSNSSRTTTVSWSGRTPSRFR